MHSLPPLLLAACNSCPSARTAQHRHCSAACLGTFDSPQARPEIRQAAYTPALWAGAVIDLTTRQWRWMDGSPFGVDDQGK